MEKTSVLHKTMTLPQPTRQRPKSDEGSPFRHVPTVSDNRHCIWITQEILNEFKSHVAHSHTVTLKFNEVDKNAKYLDTQKRKFPAIVNEKFRAHNGKRSLTSFDLKDLAVHRPVKVYVDDVTTSPDGARQNMPPLLRNKSRDYTKCSFPTSGTSKNAGNFKDRLTVSKGSGINNTRSMDSGDDGEFPDDVIETVAKANTANTEYPAHILPEIRAAPCTFHAKHNKPKGQESNYATNSHMNLKSPRYNPQNPITNIKIHQQKNPSQHGHEKHTHRGSHKLDIKIPNQYPMVKPALPKNMTSKDYVMTWLIHGSAPQGSNHFPDIVPNNHVKTKTKKTPRRSELSE